MRFRLAAWSGFGFLIALCWMLFFYLSGPGAYIEPTVRALARYSCPLVLVGDNYNFGVAYYWVFLANAVFYGMAGLVVEVVMAGLHRKSRLRPLH
jgi:hypothetical protein